MKHLITNPLTRLAIASAAVWLASIFMAHGQNKPDDLKQRILSQAQSIGANDYALPKESVLVFNSDLSHNTTAEASVGEADGVSFVEQVRLSIKPTRILLIMKLPNYESTSRFRLGPDGKPVLVEQVADVTGSGMGQEGRLHQVITYSDYKAVGKQR